MAIQHRRGSYANFDPTKMVPGEFAVVQSGDPGASDGEAVYMAFAAGAVKRLATHDELQGYDEDARIAATAAAAARDDAQAAYTNSYNSANASAGSASESANSAAAAASSADDAEATLAAAEATIAAAQAAAESAISDAKDEALDDISDAKDAALSDISTARSGALSDISDAKDDAISDISDAKETAVGAVDDEKDDAVNTINTRATQIAQMTTSAETTAAEALQAATNAENDVAAFLNTQGNLKDRVDAMELEMYGFPDDAYVEDGKAYFTHNGQVLFEVTGIGGGGGGGGGGASTTLTVTNTTGWLTKTIASGRPCEVSLTWSSTLDSIATGDGTLNIYVNNIIRASIQIHQGNVTQEVGQYLQTGSNTVRVQVVDVDGNSRAINFQITCVELGLSSSFDANAVYQGAFSFPCTPVGAVEKTIYYYLDGMLLGMQVTSVSNRQVSYPIPAQAHGAHSIRVYFEATINQETVTSNELYFEFIVWDALDGSPIIASNFNQTTADQYSIVPIPFRVYSSSLTTEVKVYEGETLISTQTVDRSWQSFSYRANTVGETEITFKVEEETKTVTFTVTESQIDVEPVTEDLVLYLTAEGRSNNEQQPGTWTYGSISASFSGFNWVSDGWQKDDDGATCLRVAGDARVTIPYKVFETDFRSAGKTIELEFATRDVMDYDTPVISCMSGGRGFSVSSQAAGLASDLSSISTPFKEDEHVRVAFVVENRSKNRLIYCYINGVLSSVTQYPDGDNFAQISPVNITIGSDDSTVDIYNIRVYDNDLTMEQVLENWIADTPDGTEMRLRYERNAILDANGNVVISNLPNDLPYMIIACNELPQFKGDKKTCEVVYTDPKYPSKSFSATNVQIDVQGTSSQYYPRKNYKMKYSSGFTVNGQTKSKYQLTDNCLPTKVFCMKADFASSEGANNVELVRAYCNACPYETPAQEADTQGLVRQGIDGIPCVIFWDDGVSQTFIGKYNFNLDKGSEECFGFAEDDESWEVKTHASDRVLWKISDYESMGVDDKGNPIPAWLNDFEARYPDDDPPYTDSTQLKAFSDWIIQTNTEAATGDALPESVTYDGTTYTSDTAAYRLAKFKAEVGNYVEVDSMLFYYLFTELFLMVDSRAKNMFPSFMGTEVVGE